MDKKYLQTAIVLARMYGIAETLNPWDYLEHEEALRGKGRTICMQTAWDWAFFTQHY